MYHSNLVGIDQNANKTVRIDWTSCRVILKTLLVNTTKIDDKNLQSLLSHQSVKWTSQIMFYILPRPSPIPLTKVEH